MRAILAALVIPVMVLAPSLASADRATAEFFAERGDKALSAKQWAAAEDFYRRALEEDETLLPARFGLANALLGSGQRALAVTELRRFCEEAQRAKQLPPAWKSALKKGKKLLAKTDALGTKFTKLVDEHVNDLLAFASRWRSKDPSIAAKALTQVLALRPRHERAMAILEQLRRAGQGKRESLFNGKNTEGWTQMNPRVWRVEDGQLIALAQDGAYMARSERRFKGDFDVLMEARLLKKLGRVVFFALIAGYTSETEKTSVGFLRDEVTVLEYRGSKEFDEVFSALPRNMVPPFELTEWNVFELRFRKDRIHAFVNGKEVHDLARRPARDTGFIALVAQECELAIKRIEFLQR